MLLRVPVAAALLLLGLISGGSRAGDPPFYADKSRLLVYLDDDGREHEIQTAADWQKRREHILANLQLVTGPLPGPEKKVPLDFQVLDTIPAEKYTLKKISFATEPGDRVGGYLLLPKAQGRRAAILCPHQTNKFGSAEPAGLAGRPTLHCAKELAERGYVTLSIDYPNFGQYQFDPYAHGYASATMKGIWNHMRAVDLLESLVEVDPTRVGVIGHSLGGHNSIFTALFDQRIKCIVSCCGFCSFARYYGGDLTGWSHQGYMPRIAEVHGRDPARMPFDFTELIAALAPRPFLAVAPLRDANFDVQGVRDCIAAAAPVYKLLGAEERLQALYPDAEHDFPDAQRRQAYQWFDRWLNGPRRRDQASP
jgi:dienelactone hydrolase